MLNVSPSASNLKIQAHILDFLGINVTSFMSRSHSTQPYTPILRLFVQHLRDIYTDISVLDGQLKV